MTRKDRTLAQVTLKTEAQRLERAVASCKMEAERARQEGRTEAAMLMVKLGGQHAEKAARLRAVANILGHIPTTNR